LSGQFAHTKRGFGPVSDRARNPNASSRVKFSLASRLEQKMRRGFLRALD